MNTTKVMGIILFLSSTASFAATSYTPIAEPTTVIDFETDYNIQQFGVTNGGYNVSAAGLEWIRWDVTRTLSVNEALDTFPEYRLATGSEVAKLYDHYDLLFETDSPEPFTSWSDAYDTYQGEDDITTHGTDPLGKALNFFADFGINFKGLTDDFEQNVVTAVIKKQVNDSTYPLSTTTVANYNFGDPTNTYSYTEMNLFAQYRSIQRSIALVRVPEIDIASAPLSLALLMGLFAINRERRKKRSV